MTLLRLGLIPEHGHDRDVEMISLPPKGQYTRTWDSEHCVGCPFLRAPAYWNRPQPQVKKPARPTHLLHSENMNYSSTSFKMQMESSIQGRLLHIPHIQSYLEEWGLRSSKRKICDRTALFAPSAPTRKSYFTSTNSSFIPAHLILYRKSKFTWGTKITTWNLSQLPSWNIQEKISVLFCFEEIKLRITAWQFLDHTQHHTGKKNDTSSRTWFFQPKLLSTFILFTSPDTCTFLTYRVSSEGLCSWREGNRDTEAIDKDTCHMTQKLLTEKRQRVLNNQCASFHTLYIGICKSSECCYVLLFTKGH